MRDLLAGRLRHQVVKVRRRYPLSGTSFVSEKRKEERMADFGIADCGLMIEKMISPMGMIVVPRNDRETTAGRIGGLENDE